MAFRYALLRLMPRLDGRWLLALLVVGALVGAASLIRWTGPAPPLDLVALGPEGRFEDTLRVPARWGDTATHTPDAVVRVPLILGVRNLGREPVTPERLSLSVPVRYRLTDADGQELPGRIEAGSPLVSYTLRPGLDRVEPQRLPTLIPAHDTLWLEVVIPTFYCVSVGDSIPEFVIAPPPPVRPLSDLRVFYSFEGGDLGERRTGTLSVRLDSTLLAVEQPPAPPAFPMEANADLAQPDLGALQRVGSRRSVCGEPESPMEILSTVWRTPAGGRFITLDYGGKVRKRLYDLDGDGMIERESWAPAGDGRFTATRRARFPIPGFLLPATPGGAYPLARFDSLSPDSLARLDPFRRAMRGPGPVPGGLAGPGADSASRRLLEPGGPGRTEAAPAPAAPALDALPEPRIERTGPLGRPARLDTIPDGRDP
jgi:hypothetical protein